MSRLRLDLHAAIALLSQSSDLLQNISNACRTALTESERTRWLVQDIIGSDQLKEEIKERRYRIASQAERVDGQTFTFASQKLVPLAFPLDG